jgi:hypothetical protein
MKYWMDTAFIERPYTIDLISIGLVAEDGREFYAESSEVDWTKASHWTLETVRHGKAADPVQDHALRRLKYRGIELCRHQISGHTSTAFIAGLRLAPTSADDLRTDSPLLSVVAEPCRSP